MKRLYKSSLILLSTAVIAGCGAFKNDVDETKGWTAPQIYEAARESVREGEWKSARRYLAAVESRHPYSSYAQQSLIDLAYVNWKDDEPEQATAAIDRFLALYPNHPGTDYMLYLKGMVTFTPPSAFLTSYTGQDPSERDPRGLRQSYTAFKELVERYPESRYANDARQRLVWLVSTIADNEANIAEYYYIRNGYVAAINRAQGVLREFSGVQAAERALFIMMKSYEALNMTEEANDAKRVLDQNFPDSKYYKQGLTAQTSWMDWFSPKGWFN
ncbi:outer membrane protein assembly factor BamD [Pelistega suis]|uniref:Outer membrane protein assembly factor BamD n=1 Tax=Pelistega suis TaxID=1631957 RepID=A0A849P3K9_9BURK|nr:outer membrane protein assembly factor BamD [Pelistega suis]NOL51636.1 outer membrane protein assembly factor BamD [Pelistega suis]